MKPEVMRSFTLPGSSAVRCVVALPHCAGFATGQDDGQVVVWSSNGAQVAELGGHTDAVSALAARGEASLVSGSWDHSVRVWEGGECKATLVGHVAIVEAVQAHPRDEDRVVSVSSDHTVRVWGIASALCLQSLDCGSHVSALGVLSDGAILTGAHDRHVRLWGPDGSLKLFRHPDTISCLAVMADDSFVVACGTQFSRSSLVKWGVRGHGVPAARGNPTRIDCLLPLPVGCLYCDTSRIVVVDAQGRTIETLKRPNPRMATVSDRVIVAVSKRVVEVRMTAVWLLGTAWCVYKGKPPRSMAGLPYTLSLRRFCRLRGQDEESMPWEVVEPFARDIVRFL